MRPNDADQPWRVAEFRSSSDPRRKVLMIAVGDAEIEAWGKRGDFCRWMDGAPSHMHVWARTVVFGQVKHYTTEEVKDAFARMSSAGMTLRKILQDYLVSEEECNSVEFEAAYSRKTDQELADEILKRLEVL
jgi:hypothetical protein